MYAWAKDAAGNVSTSATATTVVTLPDTTPPTVTVFAVPATSSSLTISITTLTATDNIAVSGYMVNESAAVPSASATGWSASASTSYTFTTAGSKTLYAWAKDAAGNVSASRSASTVVSLPPTISSGTPASGSSGVPPGTSVSATFSKAMDSTTISTTTFLLKNSSSTTIPSSVTYDSTSRTATPYPSTALGPSQSYTATILGGSTDPRVKDTAGNAMSASYSWSFITAAQSPINDGPGGPVLVIISSANPFTSYYAEILRAEGLNEFSVIDIGSVTTSLLANYDVAILGEISLTSTQVASLTQWVNSGGNLIAMKPDKQLASMLGLTSLGSTMSNAYLLVNTSSSPGAGIVNQTIQYHGAADLYTVNSATTVATLYSSATQPTSSPAVTLKAVGSNGGYAAAFTYDLAKSVSLTRQGNPAWAGQERDGVSYLRSDDMFYGASSTDPQPDWVNLTKVAIPQADEQQRLLANLIIQLNAPRKPLPRFWYFPRDLGAIVVMTGDDHKGGGTEGGFANYAAASPTGCSVDNWECIRSTSYLFVGSPMKNDKATYYPNLGFEVALHLSTGAIIVINYCGNWTPSTLQTFFSNQLSKFAAQYPGVSSPASSPW